MPTCGLSISIVFCPVYPFDRNDVVLLAGVVDGCEGLLSEKLPYLCLHCIEPIRPIQASFGLIKCGWVCEYLRDCGFKGLDKVMLGDITNEHR
jgi:hypothetical protein